MKNMLIAQSGGPSAAINATVAGVVERCITSEKVDRVYGAVNGIKGVLNRNFVDLTDVLDSAEKMKQLCHTPSSALGSCRFKLEEGNESQIKAIVDILREKEIGYFVYIGGNDSMDTVHKLSQYVKEKKIKNLSIMGAPKTIDNDLTVTDHCPGFGSAAKYIATTFSEIVKDCEVYDIPAVTIVEVMGRNAGWLTAASALSRQNGGTGPQLIYLCEKPFIVEEFLQDLRECFQHSNAVVVAVSEGLKTPNGEYLCALQAMGEEDVFGHVALSGTGRFLEGIVRQEIGCKARSIELNLMQRCATHLVSSTDIHESRLLGMTAADRTLDGISGQMAVICRISNHPYKVLYRTAEVAYIANDEKKVPLDWINKRGNDVKQELIDYIKPLIQGEESLEYQNGVPVHLRLY